ncbi:10536_t:CDS:2, partial [Rhizophagus irregularis]
MLRAQQQFIPGPLPKPIQLRRNMTILFYNMYCHPVFPVNHPDFGRIDRTMKSSSKTGLETECSVFSRFKEYCRCNCFTPSIVST